jgi:hypothetical protein
MSKKAIIPQGAEQRILAQSVEIRMDGEAEESKPKVRGYAAKFNVESENLGSEDFQFIETIAPGAFDDVLKDDVRALFNHDPSAVLARSKNGEGTLTLGVDETGLWYEFEAPDTQAGRDLVTSIERGDVDQSSFSFIVGEKGQKWEETKDGEGPTITRRMITKIKRLLDVSPVTYPAYPDATVALRSFQQYQQENRPDEDPTAGDDQPQEQLATEAWAAFDGLTTPHTQNQNTD